MYKSFNDVFKSKDKIVPVQAMQVLWGAQLYLHPFLTSTQDRSEWLTSDPATLLSGKHTGTHSTGGWVGLRAVWTLRRREK